MADKTKPEELNEDELGEVTGGLIDTFPTHFTSEDKDGKVASQAGTNPEGLRDASADGSKIVANGGGNTI